MQRTPYRCGIDSLSVPFQNLFPEWLDTRYILRRLARRFEKRRKDGVVGNLDQWVQPMLIARNGTNRFHCLPAHPLGSSNLTRRLAHPESLNDLTNFEHLKPPECHRVPPREIPEDNAIKKSKTAKTSPQWPHLVANRVALTGRKSAGSIWPQIRWLHRAATEMALCARKFTPFKRM